MTSINRLFSPSQDRGSIYTALALGAVGGIIVPELAKFTSWIRFYFLQPSRFHKYKRDDSWALVTGASDGIGYGFVQELASKGFNVILHGRNPTKVDGLIAALRKQYPTQQFEGFICSAIERGAWHQLDELVTSLRERKIKLTVLVNNVGGNPHPGTTYLTLPECSADGLTALVDMNATFPIQASRAFLPLLVESQPSLMINIGSAVGVDQTGFPWLVAYGGGKAFDRQFSRALHAELAATGNPEVEVVHVVTGSVQSSGLRYDTSITMPSSRDFAASTLAHVGSGRSEIAGWWSHSVQIWLMSLLPEWLHRRIIRDIMSKLKADHDAEVETQRKTQ